MALTKKHYERIAEIFSADASTDAVYDHDRWLPKMRKSHRDDLARSLARYFQSDNPRFDRERFLRACDVDGDGTGG